MQFIIRYIVLALLVFALQLPQSVRAQEAWEGTYLGLLLGNSWTDMEVGVPNGSMSDVYTGITGGITIGNNAWVTDTNLVGIEADIVLHDIGGDMSMSRHRVSFTGRVGQFIAPNFLLFGVAGISGGQYRAEVTATSTTTMNILVDDEVPQTVTTTTTASSNRNRRLWGYTFGGGFETTGQIVGLNIRWGAEYRFTDFGDWKFSVAGQQFSIDPDVHDLRFRAVLPF